MRQRKIKDIDEKIEIFGEPLVRDPIAFKGRWREAFGEYCDSDAPAASCGMPLYLEIGSGKGRFITESAIRNPGALYLGFEGQQSVLYRALQRTYAGPDVPLTELNAIARALTGLCDGDCARCGNRTDDGECEAMEEGADELPEGRDFAESGDILAPPENLRLCAEYILDMRDYFAPRELDGIFLNFSDPWPKNRQQKRRLTSPRYLDGYRNVLKDGGFVRFKTDNADFFDYSLASVGEHPGFEITVVTRDLHASEYERDNVMTEYEKRFLNLNKKICMLEARKRAQAAEADAAVAVDEAAASDAATVPDAAAALGN